MAKCLGDKIFLVRLTASLLRFVVVVVVVVIVLLVVYFSQFANKIFQFSNTLNAEFP